MAKKSWYRLLRGVHCDDTGTYEPGDKILSEKNLLADNPQTGSAMRFQYLGPADELADDGEQPEVAEDESPAEPQDDFDTMSLAELRQFALQEGIKLGPLKNIDAIRNLIRSKMQAV